jgi:hypothetical protein
MKHDLPRLATVERTVAERRCFGLLAHAEPSVFWLFKFHLEAAKRHALDLLMGTVAKRLFLAQSTGAPGVIFIGYY